jgi:hypothetical protein
MQDRSPPARRNHLQRTVGPYMRVKNGSDRAKTACPLYPHEPTSSDNPDRSIWCEQPKSDIKDPRTQPVTLGVLRAAAHPKGAPYLSGG